MPTIPRKKLTAASLQQQILAFVRVNGRPEINVQNVARLDDQAPPSPDETCCSEGGVLSEGKLLSWAGEIGDSSKDNRPLLISVSTCPSSRINDMHR
jgi:hypothetical protein